MNGERQMLPVHTIRIRASSPMTEIPSGYVLGLGNERGWHALIVAFAPGPLHQLARLLRVLSLTWLHPTHGGGEKGGSTAYMAYLAFCGGPPIRCGTTAGLDKQGSGGH